MYLGSWQFLFVPRWVQRILQGWQTTEIKEEAKKFGLADAKPELDQLTFVQILGVGLVGWLQTVVYVDLSGSSWLNTLVVYFVFVAISGKKTAKKI